MSKIISHQKLWNVASHAFDKLCPPNNSLQGCGTKIFQVNGKVKLFIRKVEPWHSEMENDNLKILL
jgi:hypothetical protein